MEKKGTVARAKEVKADLEKSIACALEKFVGETGLMVADLVLTRHVERSQSGAVLAAYFEVSAKVEL